MPSAIRLRVAEPIADGRTGRRARPRSPTAPRSTSTIAPRTWRVLPRTEAGAGRTAALSGRRPGTDTCVRSDTHTAVSADTRCDRGPSAPGSTRAGRRVEPRLRVCLEARRRPRRAPRRARRGRRSADVGVERPPAHRARSKRRPRPCTDRHEAAGAPPRREERGRRGRARSREPPRSAIARRLYPRPAHAEDVGARGSAERADVREQVDERLEDRLDASSLRLLEHHLRDQGAVRVAAAAPRVRVAPRPVPAEDRRAQRRDAHAQNPGFWSFDGISSSTEPQISRKTSPT